MFIKIMINFAVVVVVVVGRNLLFQSCMFKVAPYARAEDECSIKCARSKKNFGIFRYLIT